MKKTAVRAAARLLILGLLTGLTGCTREQAASYTRTQEQENGVTTTDTFTLAAEGDALSQLTNVCTFDWNALDAETQEILQRGCDSLVERYASSGVEGVACTGALEDGVYTITLTVDTTGSAMEELAGQGLVSLDGEGSVSFEKTCEALESEGYTAE